MSRSRNIKPGFFKNDLLAECHPLARILFCGLWCEADREGRLHDRPKRIKADCLPYDECDCDELLNQLDARGFIVRYQVGEDRYIAIPEFAKHQNPHCKEQPSTIPAPDMHGASTVQDPSKDVDSTELAGLIPDSLTLIPSVSVPNGTDVGASANRCPTKQIVNLYHEVLPTLSRVEKITTARQGYIRQRWLNDLTTLEEWRNYFQDVKASDFLMGRVNGSGDKPPFRADLEWLCRPGNFAKVAEGKYHRRTNGSGH